MSIEKRWINPTADGGHVSIGRHTDQSEHEIEAIAGKLRQARTGGWLAAMEGSYYGRRNVMLLMVREIGTGDGSWEEALAAFERTRRVATASPKIGDTANDPS